MGVLIKVHENTIIKLPMMAFPSPPFSESGPGVLFKNKSRLKAEKPLKKRIAKIQIKKVSPMVMALMDKNKPIKFVRLRLAYKDILMVS